MSNSTQEAFSSGWHEIDGWEDSDKTVQILWKNENGENHVSVNVVPRTGAESVFFEVEPQEIMEARSHLYPYAAAKVGHFAAVHAFGIPEAA